MNQFGFQAKKLVQLALPVLIAQVTQTMMGFIDTVMAGRSLSGEAFGYPRYYLCKAC